MKTGGLKEHEITAELKESEQGVVSAGPAVPDGSLLADLPPMPPGDARCWCILDHQVALGLSLSIEAALV